MFSQFGSPMKQQVPLGYLTVYLMICLAINWGFSSSQAVKQPGNRQGAMDITLDTQTQMS